MHLRPSGVQRSTEPNKRVKGPRIATGSVTSVDALVTELQDWSLSKREQQLKMSTTKDRENSRARCFMATGNGARAQLTELNATIPHGSWFQVESILHNQHQGTARPNSLQNEGSSVVGGTSSFSNGFGVSTKHARNGKIGYPRGSQTRFTRI